ncbi:MAG: O-antigen ligase family protein, partial [Bacteroidales bacterium]|nr:O-antigen ligase family protein [Bacteroidales bacterium]
SLICVFFLSSTMLLNDIIHHDFGQRSYAGNRIQSAFYVFEGLMLFFCLCEFHIQKNIYRYAISGFIVIGYIAIFLSLGRMVTAIAILSFLFLSYKSYIKWYVILLSFVLLIFIILTNATLLTSLKNELIRTPKATHHTMLNYNQDEMAAFTSGRSRAYKVAWHLYLKNPLLGIGYDRWASDINKGSAGSSLHSRWLQIIVETGPLGFILYLLIYLFSFLHLADKSLFIPGHKKPLRDSLLMALTGFFIIGITDNHGYTDRIFFLIIALIASYNGTYEYQEKYL